VFKAFLTFIVLGLLNQGCTPAAKTPSFDQSSLSGSALYEKDKTLLLDQSPGATDVDTQLNGAYTNTFSGTTPADLVTYLDARMKIVMDEAELDHYGSSPASFTYENWLSFQYNPSVGQLLTMAYNLGSLFFLMGEVNQTPVSIYELSTLNSIPINSMRDGLVILGPGYAQYAPGSGVYFYPELRIATLVHESRHSDCTGGLAADFVTKAQAAASSDAFLADLGVDQIYCGHLHIKCLVGSDLAGIVACDAEVWGAYGVETIYTLANLKNYSVGSAHRNFLESVILDAVSRLPADYENQFKTSVPDMSHTEP
jgi:hypothetical protein